MNNKCFRYEFNNETGIILWCFISKITSKMRLKRVFWRKKRSIIVFFLFFFLFNEIPKKESSMKFSQFSRFFSFFFFKHLPTFKLQFLKNYIINSLFSMQKMNPWSLIYIIIVFFFSLIFMFDSFFFEKQFEIFEILFPWRNKELKWAGFYVLDVIVFFSFCSFFKKTIHKTTIIISLIWFDFYELMSFILLSRIWD